MKILLDQSTPRGLGRFMPEHEVRHAAQLGWEKIANGKLLKLSEEMATTCALSTNNWNLMKPHVSAIVQAAEEVKPGEVRNLFCGRFIPRKFRRTPAP